MVVTIFISIQGAIFALWPPPKNVMDWFALLQKTNGLACWKMDLLLTVDYMLLLIIFSPWAVLRQTNPSLTMIALIFQALGTAAYMALPLLLKC